MTRETRRWITALLFATVLVMVVLGWVLAMQDSARAARWAAIVQAIGVVLAVPALVLGVLGLSRERGQHRSKQRIRLDNPHAKGDIVQDLTQTDASGQVDQDVSARRSRAGGDVRQSVRQHRPPTAPRG